MLCGQTYHVEEFEQTLASCKAAHQSDASIARQLSAMELTERLSSARLNRLKAGLPGIKARTALLALADSSVFLDPPAAEITNASAPDADTLNRMMASIVNYVNTTLQHLPNFFATREMTSFESQPPQLTLRSKATVTYRNGEEVVEKANEKSGSDQLRTQKLVMHGVFGPILSIVLKDTLTGSIRWGRWETGTNGAAAVILFAVPLEKSHYSIGSICHDISCVSIKFTSNDQRSMDVETVEPVAYHGEIAFDPTSGAILRITVVAEIPLECVNLAGVLKAVHEGSKIVTHNDIFVEYGAVEIGGKSYICPVRSVSLLTEYTPPSYNDIPQRLLNDVVFRQYRRFGSEVRMLTPDTIEPVGNP